MNRRNLIASLIVLLMPPVIGAEKPTAVEGFASGDVRDDWISKALAEDRKKSIAGQLQVQRFADGFYIVLKPMNWKPPESGPRSTLKQVVVPVGFVTDLASIPQPFWSLAPRDGDYVRAAVIHDYLYWLRDRDRADCDEIFKDGMEYLKIGKAKRTLIYKAVRKFGDSAWKENGILRDSGERRVLSKFPNDTENVTWKQWKARPDVF